MEIKLPTSKVLATSKSPKNLVIFSKPKAGKTTVLSQLENCLILDLESGSDYVDAIKMKATSLDEVKAIGKAIKDAGNPYDYVAIDTITALEEMCLPYAEELYTRTPMGKSWPTEGKAKYGSILNLPNGAGYPWLREAFVKVIEYVKTWAPRTILVGHVKDTLLEKNGSTFSSLDLALTGKLKLITTSNSDAIGYLFRRGSKNILSFKTTDEISCGARPEHLRNQEIEISDLIDNQVVVNWDKVFID